MISYIYIHITYIYNLSYIYKMEYFVSENGRQHRGDGMVLFLGRCHPPNVTAVERLKSRWAMIQPMSTRVAMTTRSPRVMVPSVRKSDADVLHQIPI